MLSRVIIGCDDSSAVEAVGRHVARAGVGSNPRYNVMFIY